MTSSGVTTTLRARRRADAWEIVKPVLITAAILTAGLFMICWPLVRETLP